MIVMVDLQRQHQALGSGFEAAVLERLRSCQFILGAEVAEFEQEVAQYIGVRHAIGCASGTDALHLSMRVLGLKPGDEVITSAFTFAATVEAIAYVGATPVFADIDPRTFNLCSESVARCISNQTRAILPVHLFGQPARLDQLQTLAEQANVPLIEDSAQSFGAMTPLGQTGSVGALGCFSFFPSKNLGAAGDAGMVTTQDDELAARLRLQRHHGESKRYHHTEIGLNSRLDALQACVLRQKLPHIDQLIAGRRLAATRYLQALDGLPVELPYADGYGTHSYNQFTILLDHRDQVRQALTEAQIASAIYYPIPMHQQRAFQGLLHPAQIALPQTEAVAARCLSLPIFPEIREDEIDAVVRCLAKAL